jgi:hypothetical protein
MNVRPIELCGACLAAALCFASVVLAANAPKNEPAKPSTKDAAAKPAAPEARKGDGSPYGHLAVTRGAEGEKPKNAAPGAAPGAARSSAVPQAKQPFVPVKETSPRTGREVVVITNQDLEQMYGQRTGPVERPANDPYAIDAVPLPGAKPAATPARAPAPNATQAKGKGDVQAEIDRLNQKARHLRNPFLPAPKETDAERAADQGLDAAQRLERTRRQIDELEKKQKKP